MPTASTTLETEFRNTFAQSAKLYERGSACFPSGVTHDSRFLTPNPVYVERSAGPLKWTPEGHELIDYWMGHGSLILGHGNPAVVAAVQEQVGKGTHWGACHELEIKWAELVKRLVPSAEKVRFTSSGTEATLMALRVARITTGRPKIIKFAGHFHGWHDQLIIASDGPHSESLEYTTPGVPNGLAGDIVIVPPNDVEAVQHSIETHQPAAVIVEATGGHWGQVPIDVPFLRQLRNLTQQHDSLLIMDEVISGFRVHPGGMQAATGITPDLTTMAKILAGGLPGGCLAGRADLMETLAFDNPFGQKMKHPGTYNGNPLSAAAGIAALEQVATGIPCEKACQYAIELRRNLNELFKRKTVDWVAYGVPSLTRICPNYDGPAWDGTDEFRPYHNDFRRLDSPIDRKLTHAFRAALLLGGVDWMGWGGMSSSTHDSSHLEKTILAFDQAIDRLRADGYVE
ncbi:aspartate aminotransferase family protein [Thalassoroseus pseudoceratinae]|uniref:aspartate aminotransferase family protein n=1 Tax=Thalassoroseus pseudoceratinae TaxID=2713176 RepID=UPI0014241BE9|nr:aminotransferase class III-fold pyridoxal phosphate-dependent enzyme [Thalassoroseus pseudoceratinae]